MYVSVYDYKPRYRYPRERAGTDYEYTQVHPFLSRLARKRNRRAGN